MPKQSMGWAEVWAKDFHVTYERLAPQFSYETRKESAKPWEEVPQNNRALMVAVCAEVLPRFSNFDDSQIAGMVRDNASLRAEVARLQSRLTHISFVVTGNDHVLIDCDSKQVDAVIAVHTENACEQRLEKLTEQVARLEKERDAWQALYAEAREVICCCNRTDTPEKGPLYDYTCEWCEAHPEGDVVIGLLERAEAAEARIRELEEK